MSGLSREDTASWDKQKDNAVHTRSCPGCGAMAEKVLMKGSV